MVLALAVALPWGVGFTVPLWFIVLVVAMTLGIVAVIIGGRDSEFGIVGMAVGLAMMVLLLLGISI